MWSKGEEECGMEREEEVSILKETFIREGVILTTLSVTMSCALGDVFPGSYPMRLVHFYSHYRDKKN